QPPPLCVALDIRCVSVPPAGQKVKTECGTESPTECEACESGHFQAGWTQEKHCTPHRDCDQNAGFVVHQIGTTMENVECRCQNGTHCSSHECQTCRLDTHCGVGEGVQKEGGPLCQPQEPWPGKARMPEGLTGKGLAAG
uniref:TNFR-Cys domain-containing protein n=1 Tax=Salvator merianae TaxID=96440 RepID=A0A8D0E2S6_SALMN